jgi:1,2-diacylglycerol 3-beta-glucosyltransferase
MLYLMHWFVVIPWVTVRMALKPKRLVWAKTTHLGGGPSQPHSIAEGMDGAPPGEAEPELAAEL